MKRIKIASLAAALAVGGLVATPAFAGWQIWNGTAWVSTETVDFIGPTTATIFGLAYPCSTDWKWTLVAGVFKVGSVTFSGSSVCSGIVPKGLPWPVSSPSPYTGPNPPFAGVPVMTPALGNVTIGGVGLQFPTPPVTCSGNLNTVMDRVDNLAIVNNKLAFNQALGPCTPFKSNPVLTSTKPIRWI